MCWIWLEWTVVSQNGSSHRPEHALCRRMIYTHACMSTFIHICYIHTHAACIRALAETSHARAGPCTSDVAVEADPIDSSDEGNRVVAGCPKHIGI